jgi:tetratricopeptide (TPR) repeat protein
MVGLVYAIWEIVDGLDKHQNVLIGLSAPANAIDPDPCRAADSAVFKARKCIIAKSYDRSLTILRAAEQDLLKQHKQLQANLEQLASRTAGDEAFKKEAMQSLDQSFKRKLLAISEAAAYAFMMKNQLGAAGVYLDQAIKLNPDGKIDYFNRALVRSRLGDRSACLDFQKAGFATNTEQLFTPAALVAETPEDRFILNSMHAKLVPQATYELFREGFDLKDLLEFKPAILKLTKSLKDLDAQASPALASKVFDLLRSRILFARSECYLELGERDAALRDIERALKLHMVASSDYRLCARIYRSCGKFAEASESEAKAAESKATQALTPISPF